MKVKYKGKDYVVTSGSEIEVYWIDKMWQPAIVQDMLSAQLTARVQVDGEPITFKQYSGIGYSWQPCAQMKEYLDA